MQSTVLKALHNNSIILSNEISRQVVEYASKDYRRVSGLNVKKSMNSSNRKIWERRWSEMCFWLVGTNK